MESSHFDTGEAAQTFVEKHGRTPTTVEMEGILRSQPEKLKGALSVHVRRACDALLAERNGRPSLPRH